MNSLSLRGVWPMGLKKKPDASPSNKTWGKKKKNELDFIDESSATLQISIARGALNKHAIKGQRGGI